MQDNLNKYKEFFKANFLILALGLLGMIFFGYGLISLFVNSNSASDDLIFEHSPGAFGVSDERNPKFAKINIDIEGAVVLPGVYDLPMESRIKDALIAAGGLSGGADREFVAKNINLSVKLSDGAKIYIPEKGEVEENTGIKSIKDGVSLAAGQININSASEQELDTLPGVGPVTAKKIIQGRPYASIDDLLNKKIIGSKVFSQIKDKISIY